MIRENIFKSLSPCLSRSLDHLLQVLSTGILLDVSITHLLLLRLSLFDTENISLPEISELPSSQPSLDEANLNFLPPPPPLPVCAPKDLVRIGPPFERVWVLYDAHPDMEDSRKQFLEWWLTIGYGKQREGQSNMH
jgi:hypothetical protein